MDSESSVLQSVKKFFSGTLLSRITGMVRDLSMAFFFGSAPQVATFLIAYRLANLFRRLFGEGALQGGLIPQFEQLRLQGEDQAVQFFRDLVASIILMVGGCIALSIILCCCWMNPSDLLVMMFVMMPGILFLSLYALNSAILQCQGHYFLPAVAPALFNLVWIVALFFLHFLELRTALFGLSGIVSLACIVQWGMTVYPIARWKRGASSWPHPFSQRVRSLFKPLFFGLVGIGATQINNALDAIFASWADPSGPVYLWYAIRIQQLPLALLGIAFMNALLPPLSRAAQSGEGGRFQDLLQKGLEKSALFIVPCALGILVFAEVGVDLLFGHGVFTSTDVKATALCLQSYALGLIPMVYVLLLANAFYAQKEVKWPMRCSLIAVGSNVILNILFVFGLRLGSASVALATALSALLNALLLYRKLKKNVSIRLFQGWGAILPSALIAVFAGWMVDYPAKRDLFSQLNRFLTTGGLFGATLLISLYVRGIRKRGGYSLAKEEEPGPSEEKQ